MNYASIASGTTVAAHLETENGSDIPEERIQPNGVDLTVGEVYRTSGSATFHDDGSYQKPERRTIQPIDSPSNTGEP